MPAPTALKQAELPEVLVEVGAPQGDFFSHPRHTHTQQITDIYEAEDEFLLQEVDMIPSDLDFISPVEEDGGESMAIDEEGRPRFAPAKDTVSTTMPTRPTPNF